MRKMFYAIQLQERCYYAHDRASHFGGDLRRGDGNMVCLLTGKKRINYLERYSFFIS